ncbi:MAG: hypothetical protein RMK20_02070 [Verrucomicrobiales bacterium]|nr:hypothetical protein [Verrucomicrobiales bacterium]
MKKNALFLVVGLLAANLNAQTITEVFLPEYLANGNNTGDRAPTAARLTISGLLPNATYRYYVSGETNVPVGTGAGNYFGINNVTNSAGYIQGYTTQKAFTGSLLANDENTTANRYSEFTTDASGSYTGWFALVPTANARFTVGNNVRFGVILNNGSGGTSVAHQLYTTSTLLSLGQGTGIGVNQATFLVGDTLGTVPGETMVLLYDNVAGSGRPVWGTWTESDGINATAFTLWNTHVTPGRWGAYVPNDLANGIRRIEYWDIGSNSLLGYLTDDDGIWQTINEPVFLAANGDTTYDGGVGRPIGILAPIPEPSALTLLALGAALGLIRRRPA